MYLHKNREGKSSKMGVKPSNSKLKLSTISFIFLSLALLLLTVNYRPKPGRTEIRSLQNRYPVVTSRSLAAENPRWYHVVAQELKRRKIKVGLVNMQEGVDQYGELHGLAQTVTVDFDRVEEDRRWEDFFPEWIDEDGKWRQPSCPEIPMPRFEDYEELDVVVARVPCGGGGEGVRDVFRLQLNLMVANLLVRSRRNNQGFDRTVYAVFVGSCGPMWEIFRCDDLLWHEGDYWVYRPDLRKLRQKVLMPVGSCQIAHPFTEPGQEAWRIHAPPEPNHPPQKPREAYVTVLHSSESYVCGAIALARSIIQTNSTRDLLLLADDSISAKSLLGLRSAGWKIKRIDRIRSPHARTNAYNEWNYSKLRIWQLTQYEKVIFIDSDLIVLNNIDAFFDFPQLSAVGNDKSLFNSGIMLVEPSICTFETLMEKRHKVASYNGGDQGFLNQMFVWWHRWPSRMNRLKIFKGRGEHGDKRGVPADVFAVHYLGLKPWMCYMDYDCNWDMAERRVFASDAAHRRWWDVYRAMPKRLQAYCGLSEGMDGRIRTWRERAKMANLADGHWKIKVKDPRRHHLGRGNYN